MLDRSHILELPENDTIVALATPPGRGALAILRLSGPKSLLILSKIWTGAELDTLMGGSARVGRIETFDIHEQAVATVWRAPKSYTGQDLIELTVHGSPPLIFEIEKALIDAGARAAAPGEFTYRAVLNGKMSLSEAGAIQALIDAPGLEAAKAAAKTLSGEFREKASELIDSISQLNIRITADTEFPDAVEEMPDSQLRDEVKKLRDEVSLLLDKIRTGERLAQLQIVVIVGPPNAGKSTLANALLGKQRSIVHHEPGTTRDLVESECDFRGVRALLVDTAGLRDTNHGIELMGVDLAHKRLAGGDLVINVIDENSHVTDEVKNTLRRTEAMDRIIVLNKCDLQKKADIDYDIEISSLTGEGIPELRDLIASKLLGEESEAIWAGTWQIDKISVARDNLENAVKAVSTGAIDAAIEELMEAESALRKSIGENPSEDIIVQVLDNFCIGK